MPSDQSHPLRIGSWPGADYKDNYFIEMFCRSLSDAGLHVISVADPRHLKNSDIDVLHIHWPEKTFWDGGGYARVVARTAATLAAMRRMKKHGVRLVWTVHNLKPHDIELRYKPLWSLYSHQLCRLVDGFVTLSPATVEVVRRELRGLSRKAGTYAWHPPYPLAATQEDRLTVRAQLGIDLDTRVFGFLGYLRPYKGIEELIIAFRAIQGERYALLICGAAFRDEYAQRVRDLSAGDTRIHLQLRRLSDQEFSAFSSAMDVVVLPFRGGLHSGSLVHAISQSRVAVTPRSPFAGSLREAVGNQWVLTYDPPLAPEILLRSEPAGGAPQLQSLGTDISGPKLARFYENLMQDTQP